MKFPIFVEKIPFIEGYHVCRFLALVEVLFLIYGTVLQTVQNG